MHAVREDMWEQDCKRWESLVLARCGNGKADRRLAEKHIQAPSNAELLLSCDLLFVFLLYLCIDARY